MFCCNCKYPGYKYKYLKEKNGEKCILHALQGNKCNDIFILMRRNEIISFTFSHVKGFA